MPAEGIPVTLLGPQRFRTTARAVVRALAPEGTVATVNAGWQEREPDDAELDGVLEGRTHNLGLWRRWTEILAGDAELSLGEQRRRQLLDELQAVYALRLHHAMESVYAVQRRQGPAGVIAAGLEDAIATVRALDDWHVRTVREVHEKFEASYMPAERDAVARHRRQVHDVLSEATALVVPGGHVAVLLDCLRFFDVASSVRQPVVAWSAGAMAVTERVVLFHDDAPQGHGHAEVHDEGLGLCRGVVALPHARTRLRLGDEARMAVLARRFPDRRCVVLHAGVRVDITADGGVPEGTRVVTTVGKVSAA